MLDFSSVVKKKFVSFFNYTEKEACWINKIGVSGSATLMCYQLDIIRNGINYFTVRKHKHNNKMFSLNYVSVDVGYFEQ